MDNETREFVDDRAPFLTYLKGWERSWDSPGMAGIVGDAGGPDNVAVVCADLTVEFAQRGRLASPRVGAIVPRIVDLLELAYSQGVRTFVLPQDAHPPDSPEFRAYGPHALPGSPEAQTVPELMALPFSDLFVVLPKQNLNPGVDTEFPAWLDRHGSVKRFILVGDCTDLCIYQTAMYLRLRANQFKLDYEVIVPATCVDTFETPYEPGREIQAMPHDADLLHLLFLYHMALNDIVVVREITTRTHV